MWHQIILVATFTFSFAYSQNAGQCVCVPYYQCSTDGKVITDGAGLIDERIGATCANCNCTEVIETCCLLGSVTDNKPETFSCGYTNPDGIGRIGVEADESLFGEFPWMVQIFEDQELRCGGSLIHPAVVLTAAHCVRYSHNRTYTIRAGEWDTSNTNEILKSQDRNVSSIKRHEGFKELSYHNDIALVFLSKPLKLEAHINLTCLAPASGAQITERCYTIGWGKAKFGPNQNNSNILKKVDLPFVGKADCQKALRKTRLGAYYNLHESFVCAGGEKDKDACLGDGGGPLFCPIQGQEDRYQQVGIVAWGLGCNEEGVPGVYANVANLRKWIDKEMTEKKLNTTSYEYS